MLLSFNRFTLCAVCIMILAAGPVLAQSSTDNSATPPIRVQANFNARNPDLSGTPKWQQTEQGYQATFRKNNRQVVSNYDKDGRWIRSRTEQKEGDLPENALQYVKENYDQYKYRQGYRHEEAGGTRYELDLSSQGRNFQLRFDKEGGFVQEITP